MRLFGLFTFASQLTTVALSAQDCSGGDSGDSAELSALGEWDTDDEFGSASLLLGEGEFHLSVLNYSDDGDGYDYSVYGEPQFFDSGLIRLPVGGILDFDSVSTLAGIDSYTDCSYDSSADELDCQGALSGHFQFHRR